MKVHFIAIGGKVMHNLALELCSQGHVVSGSDDEIYDPAKTRLSEVGLLPPVEGWFPEKINPDLDMVILGMHAHSDNPELAKAKELGLKIVSFPEFIGAFAKAEKRIVVCGSHGKSTTTAMIMHVLKLQKASFDFVLGGILEGFDRMVSLNGHPIIVIEGDEYLSSREDPTPKMLHFEGNIVIVTGIEWDHMNVFPTFEMYKKQFHRLIEECHSRGGKVIWYEEDEHLREMMPHKKGLLQEPYLPFHQDNHSNVIYGNAKYPMKIFGHHNMANMNAARLACKEVGISDEDFFTAMSSFNGVGKRLELICDKPKIYIDYAHAPSKVRATVEAVKSHHKDKKLIAFYELHTYSSLNSAFLPQYKATMHAADEAFVSYDTHALAMKRMPALDPMFVSSSFDHPQLEVITSQDRLTQILRERITEDVVILMMSSGTFGGLDLDLILNNVSI